MKFSTTEKNINLLLLPLGIQRVKWRAWDRRNLSGKYSLQKDVGNVVVEFTLPETNIAPKNGLSQKEMSIPTIHFQVLYYINFQGCRACSQTCRWQVGKISYSCIEAFLKRQQKHWNFIGEKLHHIHRGPLHLKQIHDYVVVFKWFLCSPRFVGKWSNLTIFVKLGGPTTNSKTIHNFPKWIWDRIEH